jgi:outer membrane protein OmpA-like peptidoglycan-associated protein
MKYTSHTCLFYSLLPCFFLILSVDTFAQTKKGLKALNKGKWDAALPALSADTAHEELKSVAFWGLSQALSNPENPKRNYAEAMRFQTLAKDAFKALKSAQRTALTKKYNISAGAIEKVRTQAAVQMYKEIEKEGTLDQNITYLDAFPKAPTRNREKIEARKKMQVQQLASEATTYEALRELTNKYRDEVVRYFPAAKLEDLENRSLRRFLEQKGVDQLGVFLQENPVHAAAKDPGTKRFSEVWKSENPEQYIAYLEKYPTSAFSSYIHAKLLDSIKKQPLAPEQRNRLTEAQQGVLAEVELEAEGNLADVYGAYEESKKEAWLQYVRKLAPSARSYRAFEKMYRHYLNTRNWKEATRILKAAQPLFPAKAQWFADMLPLLEAPEEGIVPTGISPIVNEDGREYIPVPSADGLTLYFCATERDENIHGEDVFVTMKTDTGWTKPKIIQELSYKGNQAPLSLSADGNKMMIFDGGQPFQSVRQTDGKWSKPTALEFSTTQFNWVGLLQISANDQTAVFEASYSNFADKNLYIVQRGNDGKWGAIQPLDSINTDKEERSPYLHPDMRTLYFSSAGYSGFGGLDVFKTTRLDDTWTRWSKPVNIGKELNTMDDDWAYKISTDGKTAWFSSRAAARDQDIYTAVMPQSARPDAVKIIELTLTDDQGKPFLGNILLENPATGKTEGTFKANPTGGTTFITVPNDKPYSIRLVQPGYFPVSMPLPVTAPGQPLSLKSTLKPVNLEKMVQSGQSVALNLFFDYDKSELKPESLPELRTVAEVAAKNKYKINLLGYTDNAGNTAYNQTLSQQRAEEARKALIEMGVAADRIKATGYGETNPVASNDTEAGKARNRRVEVQFIQ